MTQQWPFFPSKQGRGLQQCTPTSRTPFDQQPMPTVWDSRALPSAHSRTTQSVFLFLGPKTESSVLEGGDFGYAWHLVNSGPSLPKARHKPERRGGGKTGMIDVNGKNNKVEQKNNKKTKTMGDVTLKGYDMTNTVTKGTGVRVHKQ